MKRQCILRFIIDSSSESLFFNFMYRVSQYEHTGCLNIHGTHVTANNSTNNNVESFFCFRFENSIL